MSSLHSTCVEIKGKAVLICGKPGTGKSSLALQLIDRGAILVADDQTCLSLEKRTLMASPPLALRGLIEVRGIGICPLPYHDRSPLALCVEIQETLPERLPGPLWVEYCGVRIPCLKLVKNDPLSAIKVEMRISISSNL